jgi:hypothetical protein
VFRVDFLVDVVTDDGGQPSEINARNDNILPMADAQSSFPAMAP